MRFVASLTPIKRKAMNDTTPIYNLKAVTKETGLSPATLRAWERRYGLVKPHRSPGGHRLYSRQDIEMLKWLIARQHEGLSISQAVEMWRMQLEGTQPGIIKTGPSTFRPTMEENILVELREKWVAACQAFEDIAANQVVDQAFGIAPPETVSIEIFQKGLAQIGQGWYAGTLSVQQEHFASSIATQRLNIIISALPAPTRPESILVACPPGEEHDFILLLCSYLLRRKGWDVLYLGSNVPLDHLDQTIKSTRPAMVLSAAQSLTGAASLSKMSEYLVSRRRLLAYGGGIFNSLPVAEQRISGYYLGTDLPALPTIIEKVIINPPVIPEVLQLSPEYKLTLEGFVQRKSAILANAHSLTQMSAIERENAGLAGDYLTSMIEAALCLGDIHFMDFNADWLNGFLSNRGNQVALVRQFYHSYRQAVESELGLQGKLVTEWLENAGAAIS
jgi:DNA-binding transcriptional MerR regulator